MPIGARKPQTRDKLDRSRVLPFYIGPECLPLYAKDDYKYLIHLLRTQPNDEYRILQYLLLKFYPLIVKTCKRYKGVVSFDWTDLISFAKHAFVELVYRFNLDSTLYFKTYIPIALRRAVYDYFLYEKRRKSLIQATRLDGMELGVREAVVEEGRRLADYDNAPDGFLEECKTEILHYVQKSTEFDEADRLVFVQVYFKKVTIQQAAATAKVPVYSARERLTRVLGLVKDFTRDYLDGQ